MDAANRIRIGIVRKAHGIKGGVKCSGEAGMLDALMDIETFFVKTGTEWRSLTLVEMAGTADDPILYFQGVNDRNAAEELRGCELYVAAEELPELDEDEYLVTDLIGCEVVDEQGQTLGTITEVTRPGQHEVLTVEQGDEELLIPFVDEWILSVDLEHKQIQVATGEMI
jgi:16S rRNA processing protein RimM